MTWFIKSFPAVVRHKKDLHILIVSAFYFQFRWLMVSKKKKCIILQLTKSRLSILGTIVIQWPQSWDSNSQNKLHEVVDVPERTHSTLFITLLHYVERNLLAMNFFHYKLPTFCVISNCNSCSTTYVHTLQSY